MYTIKSIIPCDMLIDIDMGLVKYVQIAFAKKRKLFYPGIMDMIGPEHTAALEYALIHRKFSNPLSVVMKEEELIKHKPDEMVANFFDLNKKEILRLSTSTAIFNMVGKSMFVSDLVQFAILCKDSLEKDELVRRYNKCYGTPHIPVDLKIGTIKDIDLSLYGNVYIKDIHDIDKYEGKMEGKNIIIGNYDFNKEYNPEKDEYLSLPRMDIINKYTGTNEVQFIDVYPVEIENQVAG